jgi:hypothetical protein
VLLEDIGVLLWLLSKKEAGCGVVRLMFAEEDIGGDCVQVKQEMDLIMSPCQMKKMLYILIET